MSIIEYPKALYKGDLNQYEYKDAESKQQEEELRADGWHDFNELKLPEPTGTPIELTGISEQEHLEALERIKELELENRTLKVNAMDADELREILTERGIKFGARDGKDALVGQVLGSDNGLSN